MTSDWEAIKEFYSKRFNISGETVELIAVLWFLKKCVSGLSNNTINKSCGYDEDDPYLKEMLLEYFGFPGWEKDLDINPLSLYNECKDDYELYKLKFEEATPNMINTVSDWLMVAISYNLCKRYKEYEKELLDATGDSTRF
jgi:hypothetical protein